MLHRLRLALLIAVTCSACGKGDKYISASGRRDPRAGGDGGAGLDGGGDGRSDGATGMGGANGGSSGGGTRDGGPLEVLDGSFTLILPDGAVELPDGAFLLPDGEVIDLETAITRYDLDPNFSTCGLSDENAWMKDVEIVHEGGFALVPGLLGFGLAYRSIDSATCGRNLEVMAIPSSSGFGTEHKLLDTCPAITDVSLAAFDEGWRLAWVDNSTGTAELHTAMLGEDLDAPALSSRTTLTGTPALEMRPVVQSVFGRPLAAWIERDGDARRILAQWVDGDAMAVEVASASDGQMPETLALAPIAMDAAALAWVGPLEKPGVWVQPLDDNGMPAGAPSVLTTRVGATTSVDLAQRVEGGGAIYSIEIDGIPQVRFRRLGPTGAPIEVEKTIVGAPLRAQGASIAALGNGYVVAYRALPGGSIEQPEIRITFLTKDGNPMRDEAGSLLSLPISAASISSSATRVAVSVEGQIMVAWLDASDTGNDNLLRVARRRLDCN